MKSGNLLILQSGIPSVVGNIILKGMLAEALNHEVIEEIYGAYYGFEGVLAEQFIDLAALSQKKAQQLLFTSGYALQGETQHFQPTDEDFDKIVAICQSKGICYVGVICDQAALGYAQKLSQAAQRLSYDLQVIAVPQSNYNELPITDHSLGYGSYIKYVNAHLNSFDHAFRNDHTIGICEIDGGNNGWVVAGGAIAYAINARANNVEDIPYIVCLPEQPFNDAHFLEVLQQRLERCAHLTVITHSQLVNEEGLQLDLKGHASVGFYLQHLIESQWEVASCVHTCPMHYQPLSHFISKQDQTEALLCGRATIQQLIDEGESDRVAVLTRKANDNSACEVDFLPLQELITGTKFFPSDWISESTMTVNYSMVKYALPLIQGEVPVTFEKGLPQFAQL